MATAQQVRIAEVRAGDILVSATGRPYFRVSHNEAARARHYRVLSGERLDGDRSLGSTAGGHRDNVVTVLRGGE